MKAFVRLVIQILRRGHAATVVLTSEPVPVHRVAIGVRGAPGVNAQGKGVVLPVQLTLVVRDAEIVALKIVAAHAAPLVSGMNGEIGVHAPAKVSVRLQLLILRFRIAVIAVLKSEPEVVLRVVPGAPGAPGVTARARACVHREHWMNRYRQSPVEIVVLRLKSEPVAAPVVVVGATGVHGKI